jgi:hypothetical protein
MLGAGGTGWETESDFLAKDAPQVSNSADESSS